MFAVDGPAGMKRLLMFMTSLDEIPPLGLKEKIQLEFTSMPTFFAETCSFVLRVPNCYTTYEAFKKRFDEACEQNVGFGCT